MPRRESPAKRRSTSTSSFGTSGRFSHDSSAYYSRAFQPEIDTSNVGEEQAAPEDSLDQIYSHTSEDMHELPDGSVHLMVTSPPYNVGKDYDEDLTMDDYRGLLRRVIEETWRVMAPGGRACVNVANLGRKPYIPLHAYVISDASEVGFQMRGEIIWDKGAGAGASTAWGSWMSASNPTLRDTHEYILIFQKPHPKTGFGRRAPEGGENTIVKEDFLESTKSVWHFSPQSAKRASHPAPFPVELPRRLIQLYTYTNDVVLDPFVGTGATAMAAAVAGRRYVGYDTSAEYCAIAEERISKAVSEA